MFTQHGDPGGAQEQRAHAGNVVPSYFDLADKNPAPSQRHSAAGASDSMSAAVERTPHWQHEQGTLLAEDPRGQHDQHHHQHHHQHDQALVSVSGEDGDVLPPSNSLLSGLPPPRTPLLEMDSAASSSTGMRQRRATRTPGAASEAGPDLGMPRGLDLSSPLVMHSRSMHSQAEELGVTAAVQLVAVKSPWVTVFGYPAGSGFAVLRHFQSFGEVHEHRSEAGNWMHILYGSKVQASRALAQNGQFIAVSDGTVMIGVKPCSDPALADVAAAASSHAVASQSYEQVANERYRVRQPEQLRKAPQRAGSVCKRFWAWVLDV